MEPLKISIRPYKNRFSINLPCGMHLLPSCLLVCFFHWTGRGNGLETPPPRPPLFLRHCSDEYFMCADKDIMDRVLIEAPEQMIKFKAYKRGYAVRKTNIAYRLTRVCNQRRLPYGVWSNIVVESILNKYNFQLDPHNEPLAPHTIRDKLGAGPLSL